MVVYDPWVRFMKSLTHFSLEVVKLYFRNELVNVTLFTGAKTCQPINV